VRILIADDHELLRDALRALLNSEGGFEVQLVPDFDAALALVRQSEPFDVVLLDFSMPGMNGFAGLEKMVQETSAAVALMSGNVLPGVGERALSLGAKGFIPKTLSAKSMLNALRFIAAGELYLPMDMIQREGRDAVEGPYGKLLTARERQVLGHLCESLSNKEIARELSLSEPTVKLHVKLLCRKLQARNRTHAAMLAKEAGFC
jgi:two-component system, NarL family, nitrate/nitrite response regulator NarL